MKQKTTIVITFLLILGLLPLQTALADPITVVVDHGPLNVVNWPVNLTESTGPDSSRAADVGASGVTSWIQVNHTASTEFGGATSTGGGSGTMAAWVKLDTIAGTERTLFYRHADGTPFLAVNTRFWVNPDGSVHCLYKATSGTVTQVTSSAYVQPNVWYHLGCTISSTTVSIYNNGTLLTSATGSSNGVASSDCAFTVASSLSHTTGCGGATRGQPIDGVINDVRLYGTALNDTNMLAVKDGQNVTWSDLIFWFTFDDTVSSAPVLTATGQEEAVALQWTSVQNANHYNVYMSTTSQPNTPPLNSSYTYVTTVACCSYTATGLQNFQTYYFRVLGVNTTFGEGPGSNEANATPSPQVPGNITLTYTISADGQDATLTWTMAVGNVTGYTLYRGQAGGPWSKSFNNTTFTYRVHLLVRNSSFNVQAFGPGGIGNLSNTVILKAGDRNLFGSNGSFSGVASGEELSQGWFGSPSYVNAAMFTLGVLLVIILTFGIANIGGPFLGIVGGFVGCYLSYAFGWWPLWALILMFTVACAIALMVARQRSQSA